MAMLKARPEGDVRKERGRMGQLLGPLLFIVFAVLWVAFAVALVAGSGSLEAAWDWIVSLPLIAQLVVWVLFLPVVAGLWVWQTDWALAIRLLVIAAIAFVNLYTFYPRGLVAPRR